ncbi:uncharacterized protein [Nicotiana tomentosiformis]|uniref:uncharacterized protein n=1 Tax=Nicotiana tomentosiformis TaxID=4098 RepID=UPI00388CECE0
MKKTLEEIVTILDELSEYANQWPSKSAERRRSVDVYQVDANTSVKLEKEIGEIRSTLLSLQLADQTTLIPEGIVEDVLVRVDKFVFPMDFIVVNMEENKEVPLILGRLFLATGRDILDIHERKLMLRVGEETVTFKIDVEKEVQKGKSAASLEWKVKGSNEKAAVSEKDKCRVYPKKVEKKLSVWICALVRARGMEPNFDSDPD